MDKWLRAKPKDASHRIFAQDASALGFENVLLPASIMALGMVAAVASCLVEMSPKMSRRKTPAAPHGRKR